MRQEGWRLMRGETLLGTLSLDGVNQPFFMTTFEPTDEFGAIRPLFDEELRLAEAEDADWESVEPAYERIRSLDLRLAPLDGGEDITDFLLHIRGDEAWFRY